LKRSAARKKPAGDAAKQVQGASAELADQSTTLRGEVDGFLGKVRAV